MLSISFKWSYFTISLMEFRAIDHTLLSLTLVRGKPSRRRNVGGSTSNTMSHTQSQRGGLLTGWNVRTTCPSSYLFFCQQKSSSSESIGGSCGTAGDGNDDFSFSFSPYLASSTEKSESGSDNSTISSTTTTTTNASTTTDTTTAAQICS